MLHERPPNPGHELGTPIRNYVLRHPVVPEDVGKQGLRSLQGRRETGNERRRQDFENDQDRGVPLRRGKVGEEVHRQM